MPSGPGGQITLSTEAYYTVLRMLAENYKVPRIVREIEARFPEEHGKEGVSPVTYRMVRRLKETRGDEIAEVRRRVRDHVEDLWITQKRSRIQQAQLMFEDANRWVPKRLLEPRGGVGAPVVVYEKDHGTMMKALQFVREELGEDPGSRQADSLEALVRAAETARGLEVTAEDAEFTKEDAVPSIDDAVLVEIEPNYPSAGADPSMGFLDGRLLQESLDAGDADDDPDPDDDAPDDA